MTADQSEAARAQNRAWQRYVQEVRADTRRPFVDQWRCFEQIFDGRSAEDGPPPAWQPSQGQSSNLQAFMTARGIHSYAALHEWSVTQRATFWGEVIARLGIVFVQPPDRVLDLAGGVTHPRWLPGATLNIVDSCFTAPKDKPAIVSASERSRPTVTTYGALERLVNRTANGLREHGFHPGDTLGLYMPMTVECVVIYLAIIRAGLQAASIADSFSAQAVALRCEMTHVQAIVTVESYQRAGRTIRLYDTVKQAGTVPAIVIGKTADTVLRAGDRTFETLLSLRDDCESFLAAPDDAMTVLFSSGTTGVPKPVPWTHMTPIKCAMDGHLHHDIHGADVVAWPTSIGWMMGPWLIFATLLNRATMALFEGAPNSTAFTRFIGASGVTVLGTVPSLVRAWRSMDAIGCGEWMRVRVLSSTGEPSNPRDALWLMSRTGYRAPIIEYLGGTEIGGGHLTATVVHAASPATFTTPALGIDVVVLDETGHPVPAGDAGELFLVPPAIGLSQRLLDRDHDEEYYAGCPRGPRGEVLRRHGDEIAVLHGGYFQARGRVDDTMNLGGIKVSSVELERVIESYTTVQEAAAVAVPIGDNAPDRLVVFAVVQHPGDHDGLRDALQSQIATALNPLFRIHDLVIVDALPRTASNKLMRRDLRDRYAESKRDSFGPGQRDD